MDDRNEAKGITAGFGGGTRHGCVALADGGRILAVCEQERVTRIRAAGFNSTGLPDEALDLVLGRVRRTRRDIGRYAIAADGGEINLPGAIRMDSHRAHACASYLSSPFTSAVIVVCDDASPKVSVWKGDGGEITRVEWPWTGMGFTDLYSACASLLSLGSAGDQRFEALARLAPDNRDARLDSVFTTDGASLQMDPDWATRVAGWFPAAGSTPAIARAPYAAALQLRVIELLLAFLKNVRDATRLESVCLGGSLFYHSSINTSIRMSGLFSRVFVPVDPGSAGVAVGAALDESGANPKPLSAFLGPSYTAAEIKATLDNCKVPYIWANETEAVETAVKALQRGRLVGWYEGAMEWGQRALGARSILANPFATYVLENLNQFLKHREPWRGYALSALKPAIEEHFAGPSESPFMECDFRPLDREQFRHVLPLPNAAIRVHVAGPGSPIGFHRLLEAFGAATGVPCLVNTSFNSFLEPIVCSPRDAIRVFYSSGVDLMVLDRYLLVK